LKIPDTHLTSAWLPRQLLFEWKGKRALAAGRRIIVVRISVV
jgi:hypothetical protein